MESKLRLNANMPALRNTEEGLPAPGVMLGDAPAGCPEEVDCCPEEPLLVYVPTQQEAETGCPPP
jgi:hypothetical protein